MSQLAAAAGSKHGWSCGGCAAHPTLPVAQRPDKLPLAQRAHSAAAFCLLSSASMSCFAYSLISGMLPTEMSGMFWLRSQIKEVMHSVWYAATDDEPPAQPAAQQHTTDLSNAAITNSSCSSTTSRSSSSDDQFESVFAARGSNSARRFKPDLILANQLAYGQVSRLGRFHGTVIELEGLQGLGGTELSWKLWRTRELARWGFLSVQRHWPTRLMMIGSSSAAARPDWKFKLVAWQDKTTLENCFAKHTMAMPAALQGLGLMHPF